MENNTVLQRIRRAILKYKGNYEFYQKFDNFESNLFYKVFEGEDNNSVCYEGTKFEFENFVKLRFSKKKRELKKDKIVDNTGNIRIWPSEEVLTSYLLKNRGLVEGKRVIELGSGFHGLAGQVCASSLAAAAVTLTDGNEVAVEELEANSKGNKLDCAVRRLVWGEDEVEEKFDLVIGADCLFFVKFHVGLVKTVKNLLSEGGKAIFVNPKRDKTMEDFVELAKNSMTVEVEEYGVDDYTTYTVILSL